MGNVLTTYTSVFTQCIRTTRRRNFKQSQQLIDVNHVPNDGFLYDDSDSDEDDDGLYPQDEKVVFYKLKK